MTRYDEKWFSEAATALLKRHTEVILSPLSAVASKAIALDQVFGQLGAHHPGMQPKPAVAVEAMSASLLRMKLSDRRERVALGYIARHIDILPPEKAADTAFIALRHVQYTSWAMMNLLKTSIPEEREHRLNLENEKLADLQRQMDRLARHNPELWESKRDDFTVSLNQGTLLAHKMLALQKPAIEAEIAAPQRHAPARRAQAQELSAA